MKEVFQNPPMVTYRRPPNLRDKLIPARIPDPPSIRPKRLIPGMKPCGFNCPTSPYIEPGTVIESSYTSKKIEINGTFNCKTRNVVYCITCEKCKLQYIGQQDERVREHIGYIRNLHTNQPTGEHFNLPGHELYHLKVRILEKFWDLGRSLLEGRES